jgi:ATP-binding cassette subfamily F protein 3
MLQKALIRFSGSLVIVSHDVDFLQPIVNKVAEIRRGSFRLFPGTIEYYLRKRGEEMMERDNPVTDSKNSKTDESASSNRKDQKRLEAELRNQKYAATKQINQEIEKLEKKIESLEEKINLLENELALEEVYKDAKLTKKKTAEYNSSKEELESVLSKWESLSEKLEQILKQF